MASKNTIKNWFLTNCIPTQAQFHALFDSYFHKDESIPMSSIDGFVELLDEKADAEALNNHAIDSMAHEALFTTKENKAEKGEANGYVPLNNIKKIGYQYLTIVNDLITGGATSLLSAQQGVVLQSQINGINALLASDNVNLDNVQEIVDAIETVQISLSSILVNDLTTGGTTKALTAEMGKNLKALVDSKEPAIAATSIADYYAGNKTFRNFVTDVLAAGANIWLKKASNTSHESLADTSDVYSPTLFDRVGGIFRSNYLQWNETSRKLTIKGSQAIWEAYQDVTDGNMGIKALAGGVESFKIYDSISNFFSTGTESGKRITRIFTEFRLVNGIAFNATEFKTLDCLASVTTMLKTIAVPTDSILTIDVYNLAAMNTAKNSLIGFAQFSFKNSSGIVTDISRDELRYGHQWSYIKGTPSYVVNTDTRIDCLISTTNVAVNFVNTSALLTAVHCEIKYNITIIPVA